MPGFVVQGVIRTTVIVRGVIRTFSFPKYVGFFCCNGVFQFTATLDLYIVKHCEYTR